LCIFLQSEICVFYPKIEIATKPRKRVQPYTASCVQTRFSPMKHSIQYGHSSQGYQIANSFMTAALDTIKTTLYKTELVEATL